MEYVLYADILFLINFSMDFITLYLTSRLTSGPPTGIRSVLAATAGSIYGTAAIIEGIDGIIGILITGVVSVAIVLISFGYGNTPLLIRRCSIFWGSAALLGGIMTALCSFESSIGKAPSQSGKTAVLFLGSAVCLLIMKALSHSKKIKTVQVCVIQNKTSTSFEALIDSGNLLSDPLSGKPVIIADRSVFRKTIPDLIHNRAEIPQSIASSVRMIPVKGFGDCSILTGFIPDSVSIHENGKEKLCDAVIAMSDLGSTFFGGYPANVPASIT